MGGHNSIFSGNSLEFKELREYNISDSARHINWRKSTKSTVVVNTFDDDRELNIVLIFLNSGSLNFANKKQKAIEALTALGAIAVEQKESLNTLFYNSKESQFFKPNKKKATIDINYNYVNETKAQGYIDYKKLTQKIMSLVKKRSIIFLIGDFLESVDLQILSQIYEVYAIIIRAKEEENLELLGELNIVDANSQEERLLNICRSSQKLYNRLFVEQDNKLFKHLDSCKVLYTKIYNSDNTVDKLIELTKWKN